MIESILGIIPSIIDRIFPDEEQRNSAKLKLLQAEQNGELKEIEASLGAILAEAKSSDPWTSRARPSFMYVMYIMILSSIPMGILYAYNPTIAHHIATGLKEWLSAIPEAMWTLFGAGYLGYTGARSFDKRRPIEGGKK